MTGYECVIIGGGAAGLAAAAHLPEGWKSLLLEKNSHCGRKLLMTGNGQCNLTHDGSIRDFLIHYNPEAINFLKNALFQFTNHDLLNLFRQQGIDFICTDRGKYFPSSLRASDILECLLRICSKKPGLKIVGSQAVIRIERADAGFLIHTAGTVYPASRILLTGGGLSYPVTGSNGDGCRLAAGLGHTITPLHPGLSPFRIKKYPFAACAGISFPMIGIRLYRHQHLVHRQCGTVLLTHNGLSGPGILHLSRMARAHDTLSLDFLNDNSPESFHQKLNEQIRRRGKIILKTYFHEILGFPIRWLETLEHNPAVGIGSILSFPINQLSRSHRTYLIDMLTGFPMEIQSVGGFEQAMVTAGGINLSEVNAKTMESRIIRNLYLAGEILDIDGDTGGYNLQAAFSTGVLAVRSMIRPVVGCRVNQLPH
ncbi:MAG: aminoacetone oxidase family FAD-binding enzyme [Candidatus Delongbacteria bacterium]|nr:aminoacetone oxidase family FAD-binding enzyme [Candidatus Delongbacteria bacterium]